MGSYRNQVKAQVIQAMKGTSSRRISSAILERDETFSPVQEAAGVWKSKLLDQRPEIRNRLKRMTISEAVGE